MMLWLAFILTTHAFWCAIGGTGCAETTTNVSPFLIARNLVSTALQTATPHTVHHTHDPSDVCSGADETRSFSARVAPSVAPLLLVWITLIFAAFTLVLVSLFQRAAVFGRDGPVCVPALHSRLVRTSLPHRAPPVFLI